MCYIFNILVCIGFSVPVKLLQSFEVLIFWEILASKNK